MALFNRITALFNRITERAQAPARDVNGSPPTSRPRIDGSPASPARDLSRLNPDGSQLFVKEEDEEGESESDKLCYWFVCQSGGRDWECMTATVSNMMCRKFEPGTKKHYKCSFC